MLYHVSTFLQNSGHGIVIKVRSNDVGRITHRVKLNRVRVGPNQSSRPKVISSCSASYGTDQRTISRRSKGWVD